MIGISGIVMDYVDTANTSMRGMMVSHSALLELLFPGKVRSDLQQALIACCSQQRVRWFYMKCSCSRRENRVYQVL
jgi:hypothetical protein